MPPGESTTANGPNAPVRAIRTATATNGRVHVDIVIAVTMGEQPGFKSARVSGPRSIDDQRS
jgi:hypothetical protein